MLQKSEKRQPGEWKANGEIMYRHCKDFRPDLLLTTLFGEFFASDIAEKINIPCWRLRFSPDVSYGNGNLTATGDLRQTFGVSSHPWVTSMTLAWQRASLGFIYWQDGVLAELDDFRTKVLGLPPKSLREKQAESERTPVLLGYSPTVLELPEDTKSWQLGVGFWFLNEGAAGADGAFSRKGGRGYSFGHKLDIFVKKSVRRDGLICIDFGSCENKDLIERCIEAVSMCNSGKKRRRIIVRSDIDFHNALDNYKKFDSKFVQFVADISHSELFPYCTALIHHGGAGTTAQALRSGVPSIVIPAWRPTDQSLWADRIEALGAGIYIRRDNPSSITIRQALEELFQNYDRFKLKLKGLKATLDNESRTSLSATVDLIETPMQNWAPELCTGSQQCPVMHSIARRKLKSIESSLDDFCLTHDRVLLPADPLENKRCGLCRFMIPAMFELIHLLTRRFFLHCLVKMKRYCTATLSFFSVSGTSFPQVDDIDSLSTAGWTVDLCQKMGIYSRNDLLSQPNESLNNIVTTPLAVDEGFTSCLYVCTEKNSDASFVLKMSPRWTVSEQVTSAEQLQHLKEMWVGARSRGKYGGMGCLVPYTWKSSVCSFTGEFVHAMEFLEGMVPGNQLENLPLIHAFQAVGEIAKLHGMFWNRKPKDWNSNFDNLASARRVVAALGRHHFNIQVGATTIFKSDPMMLGVLESFLFEKPTTIVHGDLRSANVMFPKGNKDRNARCSIIDWGGLMQGKGVFDVAYLLGTGMSAEMRNANEIKILQHYYCELDAAGANLDQYSFDKLVKDYRICLWLAAALYAIPNIYDRGTVTDENETAAEEVRSALRRNLQPILDEEVFYRKM